MFYVCNGNIKLRRADFSAGRCCRTPPY